MFPKALKPPPSAKKARNDRARALTMSLFFGISSRALIVLVEMIAYLYYGSASLFMDGLATAIDIGSSILLFVFIKLAVKPPDKDHPYGHGRYEPLAGMQLGFLLVAIGIGMGLQQGVELTHDQGMKENAKYIFLVPVFCILLLEASYQYISYQAKKQDSPVLLAESYHFRIDSLTSLVAAIALFLGAVLQKEIILFDKIGALCISLIMAFLGFLAIRKNAQQLMDKKPQEKYFNIVKQASLDVKGVLGTEKIRIQQYGPDAHVNIDIEVDPKLSVEKAHEISQKVRYEIQKEWPSVRDVIVHIEPYYEDDH